MKDRSLEALIRAAQSAMADVLAVAPFQNSDETRSVAAMPGAHFVSSVSPDSLTIDVVAGERRARVFGYGAVANFSERA
jgi:hypothetical protein